MDNEPMPHGGDIVTFRERYGIDPLDMSAGTNPLGLSLAARAAIVAALDEADRYPDPGCRRLRRALAQRFGVSFDQVVCGNGASDLIERIVRVAAPCTALVCAPTFSEYECALRARGCKVRHALLREEDDFALTDRFLDELAEDVDLVFLCEPNNPVGMPTDRALLERIAKRCGETGALLVVDECFNGFLPDPAAASLRDLVPSLPYLVILDAFTKVQGMAGVRLGFALCGDAAFAARLAQAGVPWAVSHLAQEAGLAALTDDDFVNRSREVVARERAWLTEGLASLACKVYPSQASYILFRYGNGDLFARAAREGVLLRDCRNFEGLEPGYFRVAVRTHEENERFMHVMRRVIEG